MKKIDFFNSAKLLTITIGLILGTFVMLSMAFPEEGSGNSDNSSEYVEEYPNDSTNNSGPKPRKSHYYQQASCGGSDTKHGATDYAKAVAITTGGGTVTLSDGEGGGVVTNNGGTSGSENGNSVTFEWNCGSTANQKDASATEDMHKHKVVFSATADDNHSFVGWSKTSSEDDIVSKESPYTEEMFIDDWNKNNGSCETAEKALTLTYYAIFKEKVMATITMAAVEGGSYTYTCTGGNGVVSTQQQSITTQNAITFTATPSDEYKFFGWYTMNGDNEEYFSYSSTLEKAFFANATIYAKFIPKDWALFSFKGGDGTLFYDLNKAIAVATNGNIIVVATDGTLPAGNYTIPQGVTLLIPFDDEYSCYTTEPMILHGWRKEDNSGKAGSVRDPYNDESFVYSTLTLASGAQLNIEGVVSLSAKHWCVITSGCGQTEKPWYPFGAPNPSGSNRIYKGFGLINMENNSSIQVKSGGKLYCWGRIRGEGAITAKSGAEVRESYVYTDWRNNDFFKDYAQKTRCFPQNQYYIQDIQVPITYESGAICNLIGALFYSSGTEAQKGTMNFVGTTNSNSLIELPAEATMTKKYVASEDRLYIDLENGASFNNFSLNYSSWKVATSSHIFTITNNWTVNINSGTTNMTYDLAWAPGSVLNIKQGAAVTMLEGMSMYVYDHDDWGDFAAGKRIKPLMKPSQEASYGVEVKARTYDADCPDAEFIVDGTLTVTGGQNIVMNSSATNCSFDSSNKGIFQSGLYTTEAGANIHGIGTIQYLKGCGDQTATQQLNLSSNWNTDVTEDKITLSTYTPISKYGTGMARPDIDPAQLKNADGSYTETEGFTSETTFVYENGKWLAKKEIANIEINENEVEIDDKFEGINEATYTVPKGNKFVSTDITIHDGTILNIEEDAAVETQTLALSTSPSAIDTEQGKAGTSSQIKGNGTITAQNVFIDITMDPSGTLDASKYYAFAVPFAVKVDGGVQQFKNNEWEACTHDTHYRAYTYNGAKRAANGKGSNWTLVDNNGTFQPGVFYLVEFAPGMGNVYRFTKATESDLNNAADINLEAFEFADTNDADKGWNGIANNALQNVTISLSNTGVAQVFDPAQNAFVTIELGNTQFAIGTPLFVQVKNDATATNSAVAQPASVPARMLAQQQTETLGNYIVRIAAENADKMADQLFISASEDAENNYVIGKDLVKMFMGNATTAQLWANNYDKKLSMHQALLANGSAEAPLTLYAPKAGDYKIYLKDTPEDAIIYLLEDGNVIANLNDGAYSVALTKGENTQYGLRINARTKSDVVTSINNAIATKCIKKILLQGNVYIVRDGKLFNTLGQFVK